MRDAIPAPVLEAARRGGRAGGASEGAGADTPAPTDEAVLLTEIRDLLREQRRP